MSGIAVSINGLEELVERVVEEKLAAREPEPDGWFTSDEAASYLGIARSTRHDP